MKVTVKMAAFSNASCVRELVVIPVTEHEGARVHVIASIDLGLVGSYSYRNGVCHRFIRYLVKERRICFLLPNHDSVDDRKLVSSLRF